MCVFIKTIHNSLYCINAKDREKKTNNGKEKVWGPPGRICEGNCCVVKETQSHRYYYTLLSTLIQWHFSVQQLDWSTWRYHTVDSLSHFIIKFPVISLCALLPALNLHCISSLLVCCCLYLSCCPRLTWCFPCWWRAKHNLPPWRTINIYPSPILECWTVCWVWSTPASVHTVGRFDPPGNGWFSHLPGRLQTWLTFQLTAALDFAECSCKPARQSLHCITIWSFHSNCSPNLSDLLLLSAQPPTSSNDNDKHTTQYTVFSLERAVYFPQISCGDGNNLYSLKRDHSNFTH